MIVVFGFAAGLREVLVVTFGVDKGSDVILVDAVLISTVVFVTKVAVGAVAVRLMDALLLGVVVVVDWILVVFFIVVVGAMKPGPGVLLRVGFGVGLREALVVTFGLDKVIDVIFVDAVLFSTVVFVMKVVVGGVVERVMFVDALLLMVDVAVTSILDAVVFAVVVDTVISDVDAVVVYFAIAMVVREVSISDVVAVGILVDDDDVAFLSAIEQCILHVYFTTRQFNVFTLRRVLNIRSVHLWSN